MDTANAAKWKTEEMFCLDFGTTQQATSRGTNPEPNQSLSYHADLPLSHLYILTV